MILSLSGKGQIPDPVLSKRIIQKMVYLKHSALKKGKRTMGDEQFQTY